MGTTILTRPEAAEATHVHLANGVSWMFVRLKSMFRFLGETETDAADAWRDPLSHPALKAMSAREIADLPMEADCSSCPRA